MQERINYVEAAPDVYRSMRQLYESLAKMSLDAKLIELVSLRASQINQCAFCIDMHWKELRAQGVSDQDLYMISAWREWHGYTDRERAALAWTEAVTVLTDGYVPDSVYEEARAEFDERELAELTLAIVTINGWNRLNVAFRKTPGGHRVRNVAT